MKKRQFITIHFMLSLFVMKSETEFKVLIVSASMLLFQLLTSFSLMSAVTPAESTMSLK